MPKRFFDQKSTGRELKEERALVQILRKKHLQSIREGLSAELGMDPSDGDVEAAFQMFIEDMRSNGAFQRILDRYLQAKIAADRARFGR